MLELQTDIFTEFIDHLERNPVDNICTLVFKDSWEYPAGFLENDHLIRLLKCSSLQNIHFFSCCFSSEILTFSRDDKYDLDISGVSDETISLALQVISSIAGNRSSTFLSIEFNNSNISMKGFKIIMKGLQKLNIVVWSINIKSSCLISAYDVEIYKWLTENLDEDISFNGKSKASITDQTLNYAST